MMCYSYIYIYIFEKSKGFADQLFFHKLFGLDFWNSHKNQILFWYFWIVFERNVWLVEFQTQETNITLDFGGWQHGYCLKLLNQFCAKSDILFNLWFKVTLVRGVNLELKSRKSVGLILMYFKNCVLSTIFYNQIRTCFVSNVN